MFENAPYINKMPENIEIKKEDIIYVHCADPNKKLEFVDKNAVIIKKSDLKKFLVLFFCLVCSISFAAKFCSECGKPLPKPDAKFCSECGAGVATSTQTIVIQFPKGFKPDPEKVKEARIKSCKSNLTVISGAIQMYNMDHKEPMKTYDNKALIEGNYLNSFSSCCPETNKDEYELTEDGYVLCKYHKHKKKVEE